MSEQKKKLHTANAKIIPYDIKEMASEFIFFQYQSMNLESSTHSVKIQISPKEDEELKKSILPKEKYIRSHVTLKNSCSERDFIDIGLYNNKSDEIFQSNLICMDVSIKESFINSFLRHLRNSIAHGNVYYWNKKNKQYLLFEDVNKRKKNLSYQQEYFAIKVTLSDGEK